MKNFVLAQPGTVLEAAAPGTSYPSLHDEWLPACPCCRAHGKRILVQYRVLLNNSDFLHLRSEKYYIGLDNYSQFVNWPDPFDCREGALYIKANVIGHS